MVIKRRIGEFIFDHINVILMLFLCLITLYPFFYVLFASLMKPADVYASSGIILWPKSFDLGAYILVSKNPMITTGYLNTLIYVFTGVVLNIFITSMASYSLSRMWLFGRNVFMFLIVFTMFFSGGLIPLYLIVDKLGMLNTRWALIIPGVVGAWGIIIMRTYMLGIPDSMEESAKIDGANDFTILFRIILPLSMPVVAVLILFAAVGQWNAWFGALIYLKDRKFYPLQLVLREILVQDTTQSMMTSISEADRAPMGDNIKYATIIVSTLPILCVYPFLQKYFVQGIMVGAIKG